MKKDKKFIWEKIISHRILIAVAVLVTALLSVSIFLYRAQAQFSVNRPNGSLARPIAENASSNTLGLAAKTGTATNAPSAQKSAMLEVNIANNGATLLRGARVISIAQDSFRVVTSWDVAEFTWEVQIKLFTKFLTSKGDKETLADIQVGDTLTITGNLIKGGAEPMIEAAFLRK